MAFDQGITTANMRSQFFDGTVKGFAERMYKLKQVVFIDNTGAWKNFFFRESNTPLAGQSGNAARGIPPGALIPNAVTSWERVQTVIEKYGLQCNIPWESIRTNEVNVMTRQMFRIAEGVTKAVDDQIYAGISESGTATNIQTVAAFARWSLSSAAIFDDLGAARQKIGEYNYPTTDLVCIVTPMQRRSINSYLVSKGAQFPQLGNDTAVNGDAGQLNGIRFIETISANSSYAIVCLPKVCATWKSLTPLQTTTIEDPYVSTTVRAIEEGVLQLTDPKAVVLISAVD